MNTRLHSERCPSSAGNRPSTFIRRCRRIAEWMVPGALLALLPKCPLCLAAYIAMVAGVGLSVSAAMYLHFALIFLFAASLLFLLARFLRRGRPCSIAHFIQARRVRE